MLLNLPLTTGDSKVQQHQDSQPISVSRDRKEVTHHREHRGWLRLRWVCLGEQLGLKLLSKRGKGGGHKSPHEKHSR